MAQNQPNNEGLTLRGTTDLDADALDDGEAWIDRNEAFLRIRGVTSPIILDKIEVLLEHQTKEEAATATTLQRKATQLVGAGAFVVAAAGLPLSLSGGGWTPFIGPLLVVVAGVFTVVFGFMSLRVSGYPAHSDNIILHRTLMGRFARIKTDECHDSVSEQLIPYRHVVICNTWLIKDGLRRRNATRARLVKFGQVSFLALAISLGITVASRLTISAMGLDTNSPGEVSCELQTHPPASSTNTPANTHSQEGGPTPSTPADSREDREEQ